MLGTAIRIAVASLVAIVGVTPASADPAPHMTDIAGDANGLASVNGTSQQTDASYAPADLLAARWETMYAPADEGSGYRATGLRLVVATAEPPEWEGPPLAYRVVTTIGSCELSIAAFFKGSWPAPLEPDEGSVAIDFASSCPSVGNDYRANPAWTSTVDDQASTLTLEIPFASLATDEAAIIADGATLSSPVAQTVREQTYYYNSATGIRVTAVILDQTPVGAAFTIGSDVPSED